jgi:hypothetical protein
MPKRVLYQYWIANLRVQATDLVGLLVRVEVFHFERCDVDWFGKC